MFYGKMLGYSHYIYCLQELTYFGLLVLTNFGLEVSKHFGLGNQTREIDKICYDF